MVDTGLHALGWSGKKAIDYFVENSPQAINNIVNEVDRYIGYTGEANLQDGTNETFPTHSEAQKAIGLTLRHQGIPRHRARVRSCPARTPPATSCASGRRAKRMISDIQT